jgi:large repetitive protein
VHNAVLVDGGGEIEARRPGAALRDAFLNRPDSLPVCAAAIDHEVCRDPAPVQRAAALSGTVWTDSGSVPRALDGGDRRMPGWRVELIDVASGTVITSATTGSDGRYRIADLVPGIEYAVRFRDPASQVVFGYPVNGETAPGSSGANCVPGAQGAPGGSTASSCVGSGASPQLSVVLAPGAELTQQSLPIDPSGVVYDSGTRTPVAGAVVTLAPDGSCPGWNPSTGLVAAALGGYLLNGPAASMTVGPDGFYQFLFAPAAPANCTWALSVAPPAGYAFPSAAIPPEPGQLNPPGGPGSTFAVQPQATAPTGPVGPATVYHLRLVSGSAGAHIIHNHIPADPALPGSISLAKVGDKAQAEIGDSVRYAVTVTLQTGARPRQTTVLDRLPPGFTYIPGTATVNDVPIADPAGGAGPTLAFHLGSMPASNQLVLRYRLRVGVGAAQGDGTNRAQAHACGVPSGCVDASFAPLRGSVATNAAQHRVRVGGGVFGIDACVLGKVFVDCNGNHVQDREELGIPGVRLMLSDLSFLVTDSEGKYSLCGLPPRSHAIRIDTATLPRGSRLTTSSHRNLADAGSLWLDLKSGELHRADFIEGSCSNTVLEQVKARRAQGEVRAPEVEKAGAPALRFDNKAHGLDARRSPQQGTDGANQPVPRPRPTQPVPPGATRDESNVPTSDLPMNSPAPKGRHPGQASDAPQADVTQGGGDGTV